MKEELAAHLPDQVRATIADHALVPRGTTVVVGVSGGPDSLALLHVLLALRDELQITLHAAHLDHDLRGAAARADAEFVIQTAQAWGVPVTAERRAVAALARRSRLSIEEAGRQARYAFLFAVAERVRAHAIAVAHNADDQVETVLMHLLRGAGLAGLRGIAYKTRPNWMAWFPSPETDQAPRRRTSDILLIRPLLDVRRAEVEAYCEAHHLTPRVDASNTDTKLYRNRLRHEVLPYLEKLNPNLREVLARTSRLLADDYDFLQAQVHAAFDRVARIDQGVIRFALADWRALHPSLQRGTLRLAVQHLRRHLRDIDWTPIEDARHIALHHEAGARATLPGGLFLTVGYHEFTIGAAGETPRVPELPLLAAERVALQVPGVTPLPDSPWIATATLSSQPQPPSADRWIVQLDFDKCQGRLELRRRQPGDRFQPAGLQGHTKSLHEFMIDEKIAHARRARWPLLVAAEVSGTHDRILWVCGWRADERARVTADTERVLTVSLSLAAEAGRAPEQGTSN